MKNSPLPLKNSDGFVVVILLMLAPVLFAIIAVVGRIVILAEFRSEFRFKCMTESLQIQKHLEHTPANGEHLATELLFRLQKIVTPIKYYVTLTDYPNYESENQQDKPKTLAFRLKYSLRMGEPAEFEMTCGIRLIKAGDEWQYESIYSMKEDKF